MGVYFLTVHGRSLSVPDRYGIADSEAADFTGSVRSNFGWIVRPLQKTEISIGRNGEPQNTGTESVLRLTPQHTE